MTSSFLPISSWVSVLGPLFSLCSSLRWSPFLFRMIFSSHLIPKTPKSISSHNLSPVLMVCSFNSGSRLPQRHFQSQTKHFLPEIIIFPLFPSLVTSISLHVIVHSWNIHTVFDFSPPCNQCALLDRAQAVPRPLYTRFLPSVQPSLNLEIY